VERDKVARKARVYIERADGRTIEFSADVNGCLIRRDPKPYDELTLFWSAEGKSESFLSCAIGAVSVGGVAGRLDPHLAMG
jgi:hypothetical protein